MVDDDLGDQASEYLEVSVESDARVQLPVLFNNSQLHIDMVGSLIHILFLTPWHKSYITRVAGIGNNNKETK